MIRQAHPAKVEMPARSPFDLGALLIFALAFSVVATANAAFAGHVGSRGLIATSAVSGLLDVDVATLSALRLVQTIVTPDAAGRAALAVNSIGKAVLAIFSSPAGFWVPFLTGRWLQSLSAPRRSCFCRPFEARFRNASTNP
jgi:uncharacterized membrane protein (DUF4010 family)